MTTKTQKNNFLPYVILLLVVIIFQFARAESTVDTYLAGLKTLKSPFLQYNPDGSISSGVLYISKPRYLRIEYNSPNNIIINVNGPFVTYYDKDLDQAVNSPISNTLINTLRGNYKKSPHRLYTDNNTIFLEVSDGETALTLRFSSNPIEIEGFDLLQEGKKTTVSFSNVSYNIKISSYLFSNFD